MIDFTKSVKARKRQDSVWVENIEYKIHTEFFHWVAFGRKIIKSKTYDEFDWLYIFGIPDNRQAGFEQLMKFYINEQPLPHPTKEKNNVISIEWKIDSEYIRAAFLQQYGIDLLVTDLHWHCFTALFNALKDTVINDIMSARLYKGKGKEMNKLRERWVIPVPQKRNR